MSLDWQYSWHAMRHLQMNRASGMHATFPMLKWIVLAASASL